mgnify:FL=1
MKQNTLIQKKIKFFSGSETSNRKFLIINICREKLHYYEFVKPIEDILIDNNISYFVKHYKNLKKMDLGKANRIIICGTSLADNEFVEDTNKFKWILNFDNSILGICGGMEIIGLIFEGKLKKKTEIGYYPENFKQEFLGLVEKQEVYHLHNYYIDFSKLKDFDVFCKSNGVVQAVKHKNKEIYGVLFHPEVRQKKLIKEFCGLKK